MSTDASLRTVIMPPPSDITPADRCVVLLHGYGANAHDLLPLRDDIAPAWTAIAIEAPIDLSPMGMPNGRAWFHITPSADGTFSLDVAGAESAVRQLMAQIPQAVESAGFSLGNTVIMGFSQGAMLGHALLLREHLTMRGLASCSGRMMREFVGDGSRVCADQPVFLSHGTHDELIPVSSGHELRDLYQLHTPACVTWCEEPIGHGIGPNMIESMRAWFAAV